ncbi:hypothetical protein [Paraburkholderia caledonica]|uniref:hypothetical protein n=1 Tax=Paraburkholderia caledonica TaxID=134536 RepID=UPI0011789902|nr:hypothetical protein [Paraburkholderia caledonica]
MFNSVRVAFEYGTSHTAGVATIAASTEEPINDELCDFHAAGAPLTDYTADIAPTLESMLSAIKKDT